MMEKVVIFLFVAQTGEFEEGEFGGLSCPYTYMALTWYDPNGDCCPKY